MKTRLILYKRDITALPEKIIKNGKAVFGTFEGCPKRLDIKGIRAPFIGLPLPTVVTNLRIKSSLSFMFSIGKYIGFVDFLDQKIFGFAEITFWDKETKRKYSYKKFMGPHKRLIPHDMQSGFCASFQKNRYVRLSWDHKRNRFSVIFSLKGDSSRPSVRGAFLASYNEERMNEVFAVTPAPSKRRCSATYLSTPSIHGALSIGQSKYFPASLMEDTDGFSVFSVNRAYYSFDTELETITASGLVDINGTKKRVSFYLMGTVENQIDSDNFNSNFMFLDGEKIPLPPVTITHTAGIMKTWVIQDFENMVDLTFTPSSKHTRDMSFFVVHSKCNTIYGTFEGALKTNDNKDIALSSFEGFVRTQAIRN